MTGLPLLIIMLSALCPVASGATERADTVQYADSAALRSLRALEARADSGDNGARFRLARVLESGYGSIMRRDSVRARRLFEEAAAQGYAPAQNYLGFLLYNEERPDSAVTWMMRAADRGDITAYANLGWMLLHGAGAARDYEKALYWLRKGAAVNSAPCSAMLGDMYRTGTGVAPDTLAAIGWYDGALRDYAAAPYRDAQAVADISGALDALYGDTGGIPSDSLLLIADRYISLHAPKVGIRLLREVADRGDMRAQTRVAKAYALGFGVPYSHQESLRRYALAALGGDPAAQFIVGELLQMLPDALDALPDGIKARLTPDMRSAAYWLDKAAEGGITTAAQADDAITIMR